MKVIDLLNKIANGEEGDIFKNYQFSQNDYCTIDTFFARYIVDEENLNLEIIDDTSKVQVEMTQEEYNEYLDWKLDKPKEDKKIEKLDDYIAFCDGTYETRWSDTEIYIVDKVNEIIERLNGEDNE